MNDVKHSWYVPTITSGQKKELSLKSVRKTSTSTRTYLMVLFVINEAEVPT